MSTSSSGGQRQETPPKRSRIGKACENCRVRRVKCDGVTPCSTCTQAGLQDTCTVRSKARPRRQHRVQVSQDVLRGPSPTPLLEQAPFDPTAPIEYVMLAAQLDIVRSVEERLGAWLHRFHPVEAATIDLSLSSASKMLPALVAPLPPLPADRASELAALHTFSTRLGFQYPFISIPGVQEIMRQYHLASSGSPDAVMLRPDELMLLFAALCLGCFAEITNSSGKRIFEESPWVMLDDPERPDVVYYRHALRVYDEWGGASTIALGSLHCLHLFALINGGMDDMVGIHDRMGRLVRELGVHKAEVALVYPVEDHVVPLFYATLYKDTWFALISSHPTALPFNELDIDYTRSATSEEGEVTSTIADLTLFENELSTAIHSGATWSVSAMLDCEARLADWWNRYNEDNDIIDHRSETRGAPVRVLPKRARYTYFLIRYHWLRMMLRLPCIDHPTHRLASLAVLARSACAILRTYFAFSQTADFYGTWSEARRITTAIYVVIIGWIERELTRDETREMLVMCAELLLKMEQIGCPATFSVLSSIERLAGILDVDMPKTGELAERLALWAAQTAQRPGEGYAFPRVERMFNFDLPPG